MIYVDESNQSYFGALVGINNGGAVVEDCYSLISVRQLQTGGADDVKRLGSLIAVNNGWARNCFVYADRLLYRKDTLGNPISAGYNLAQTPAFGTSKEI